MEDLSAVLALEGFTVKVSASRVTDKSLSTAVIESHFLDHPRSFELSPHLFSVSFMSASIPYLLSTTFLRSERTCNNGKR